MNSEELEKSLRTEFESHLKSVLADMRQEFSEFQEKIEAEFDKHKSQLDTVFQDFSARFDTSRDLEEGFKETVIEHLRLARDEGARITATAMTEAEEMEKQSAPQHLPPSVGVSELRDAINDITAQTSQGTILKALVEQASQFTPRGAFFIIKNEHFVGWRVFGKEENAASEEAVRDILLPVASSTVLGESVRSLSATESSYGTFDDDAVYLDKLEFGQPDRMIAIPLVARGRGVAVLYADYGTEGEAVNVEALETLVRVAGLTVEVLASSQSMKSVQESQPTVNYSEETTPVEVQEEVDETEVEATKDFQAEEQPVDEQPEEAKSSDSEGAAVEQTDEPTTETDYQPEAESEDLSDQPELVSDDSSTEEVSEAEEGSVQEEEVAAQEQDTKELPVLADQTDEVEEISSRSQPAETEDETILLSESDIQEDDIEDLESDGIVAEQDDYQVEKAPLESNENLEAQKVFDSFGAETGKTSDFVPEPASSETVSTAPVRSRFSDRNVDLPIEVGEDERRLHNDARRFARLLVSEIKLYNEQKVKEGREAQDLYERLREAIDRSRDMYDKRVQPPVAAKFDYFHYELVSTLAEGEETKLGGGYPGAAV